MQYTAHIQLYTVQYSIVYILFPPQFFGSSSDCSSGPYSLEPKMEPYWRSIIILYRNLIKIMLLQYASIPSSIPGSVPSQALYPALAPNQFFKLYIYSFKIQCLHTNLQYSIVHITRANTVCPFTDVLF
jgi:hypothetical protein